MIKTWCQGVLLLLMTRCAFADHFDDHSAALLMTAPDSKAAKKVEALSARQLTAVSHPLADAVASALVVIKTNDGNWCKLLARVAKLKAPGGKEPTQLILVERLVTYAPGVRVRTTADEKDVYLFDRFAIDLDIGKVVPAGTGEELRFELDADGGKIIAVGDADMYVVTQALVAPSRSAGRRFGDGAVEPHDFVGNYSLEADGRWRGDLVLKLTKQGKVTGSYKSDRTGQLYEVTGTVGPPANHVVFEVAFPQTIQKFDGYLWTRDRNRMSGVTTMLGQPFGFLAVRK